VPQMADAVDVMKRIQRKQGVSYPVLVPNDKGLEAAVSEEFCIIFLLFF
jgi:hydroxymethylglutaryl-CoA lyase